MQIGMMEHTTLEDLVATCLKRFEARGEILVPTNVRLAKCHYKEVLLDQFLVTRVDTEVVITVSGQEHRAHPTASLQPRTKMGRDSTGRLVWESHSVHKRHTAAIPLGENSVCGPATQMPGGGTKWLA